MNTTKTVKEYAEIIIDKVSTVTFIAMFRIPENFEGPDCFDFVEFLNHISNYVETNVLKTNKWPADKCYNILALVSKTIKKYKSLTEPFTITNEEGKKVNYIDKDYLIPMNSFLQQIE